MVECTISLLAGERRNFFDHSQTVRGGVKDDVDRTGHCASLRPLAGRRIRLGQCLRVFLIRETFSTTSGSSLLSV
jgi:hypothetical protein